MRRIYITFSGAPYDVQTERTVRDAPKFGVHDVWVYDDVWLKEQPYYEINRWLFETAAHGFGHCCWKPYIILEAWRNRSKCNMGDVILYADADTYPIANLSPVFEHARTTGAMLFESQGNLNTRFTRRDCFVAMACDEARYWNAPHACGRFAAFRVGDYLNEQLLMEWLTYSLNRMCQFWGPSLYMPDFPDFYRHSTEQSVLTLLAEKYGIRLHREACQFGWPVAPGKEEWYPQLFIQDGARSPETHEGSRFRNV